MKTTRRAVIAAALVGGAGALAASDTAREFLGMFAPLSGTLWGATDRHLPETVESPHGEATLYRDDEGVPQIEADTDEAAYFAVGYVQAFDRLFGMDLQRRIMRGEVAAAVGDMEGMVEDDIFHMEMDFVGAAEAAVERNRGTDVEPISSAFVDGVNAAIEDEPLPLEFRVLDYEPDPWTLEDSMLMSLNISWFLNGSFGDLGEGDEDEVREALGEEVYSILHPEGYHHEYPIIREWMDARGVPWADDESGEDESADGDDETSSDGSGTTTSLSPELLEYLRSHEPPESFGSNSWVVSGDHTPSDRPVVANDPHLLVMVPPLLYEQHVVTPSANVRGFTFPGIPFPSFGATEYGAWGFTSEGPDVMDLYTYDFDETGDRYRYRGEWRDVEREEKTVEVADGEDRTVTVERTVHGPLVERDGQKVGVAWTGHGGPRSVQAMYDLLEATDVDEAIDALRLMDLPSAALVYADRDETLFYQTGKVPIRHTPEGEVVPGNQVFDGSTPEAEGPGFEPYGETDWEGDGFVPFEEMPHVRNPPYLATANQGVVEETTHYLHLSDGTPDRAKRIWDELEAAAEAGEEMDLEFHEDLMTDTRDERAVATVPMLVDAIDDQGREDLADVRDALEEWDYRMTADSYSALVFDRWVDRYRRSAVEDVYEAAGLSPGSPPRWVVLNLPADSPVFVNRSQAEIAVDALDEALAEIDEEGWSVYGDWNTTRNATHPFGDELEFLNYPDEPMDGSRGTPKAFRREERGFAAGAVTRMVVEVGERASAIIPGGNSGDYFSEHYDDQFQRFLDGEFRPMPFTIEGERTTTFEPGS